MNGVSGPGEAPPGPARGKATDNDDGQLGEILSRRRVRRLFGLTGGAPGAGLVGSRVLAGGAGGTSAGTSGARSLPGCVVRPALTEGPYFVANTLDRSDIRSDVDTGAVKPGVPLTLTFLVSRVGVGECGPRSGIKVDVWHCDALGVYSGAQDPGYDTRGLDFLRGYQLTDARGRATFRTITRGGTPGGRCISTSPSA